MSNSLINHDVVTLYTIANAACHGQRAHNIGCVISEGERPVEATRAQTIVCNNNVYMVRAFKVFRYVAQNLLIKEELSARPACHACSINARNSAYSCLLIENIATGGR